MKKWLVFCLSLALLTSCQGRKKEGYTPVGEILPLEQLEEAYGVSDWFWQFTLSQEGEGKSLAYRLRPRGKDFTILVPGAQNELRLCRGGEEVVFSIPWLFPGEDRPTATLALGDVTGDGEEELLYLAGWENGDGYDSVCYIIDTGTFTSYSLPAREGNWYALEWDDRTGTLRLGTRDRYGTAREAILRFDGESGSFWEDDTTLDQLLERMTAEEMGEISWPGQSAPPERETLAAMLATALKHRVERVEELSMGIAWELSFELWPAGQEGDMVYLWAGLEENVVEIYAAGRLPRGRIMVEDEALYQLLRTSRDGLPRVEDESYADYKWAVDDYYDARVADMNQLLAESGLDWRVAGWELGTFHLVGENTDVGTQAYLMADLWYTDPPEKVCNMLTGGAYVDSSLRLHSDGWRQTYLGVVDGRAVGVFYLSGKLDMEQYPTKQAFLDMMAANQEG